VLNFDTATLLLITQEDRSELMNSVLSLRTSRNIHFHAYAEDVIVFVGHE
jgi:hypothetical protein